MGFDGLIVSDGLEMGGLAQSVWSGESAIRAVEAGIDILLLPIDVRQAIKSIEEAVKSGRLSEERIDKSVEKIWKMKNNLGLLNGVFQSDFIELEEKIGISKHQTKSFEIAKKSITIVKDDNSILPFIPEEIDSLAHIIFSLDDNAKSYVKPFSKDIFKTHGHVKEIFINAPLSELGRKDLINKVSDVDNIIVSLIVRIRMDKGIATIDSTHSLALSQLKNSGIPMAVFSFGSPYLPSYEMLEAYVCVYGYGSVSVKAAANALWGRAEVNGKLPVDLSPKLKRGMGLKKKKRYNNMGDLNILEFYNAQIILENAIKRKVFPGAQVSIVKKGKTLFNRSFGNFTYDAESSIVNNESIYDIASLTKVLVTTPIIMKLVEQKKLSLDHKVVQYYPQFNGAGKENITIKNLLTHSSGLPGYYQFFLDENIRSKDILDFIININLNGYPGDQYEYSDLGFILLTSIIEKVTGKTIDRLAHLLIFDPLGMKNTRYLPPLNWKNKIVPTEIDTVFRKKLIHAEVHDENTYIMDGVSGHAGIFSNSIDISYFSQMMLNKGLWDGKRYFKEDLITKFTLIQDTPKGSDMAIGWDTPAKSGKGNAGKYFSSGSYGHLGFTGTSLWIDPKEEIIIILLTNRVHPSRNGEAGVRNMRLVRRDFYDAVMEELVANN
jgi:CubicO group peptidase (beta-lactamase class C family)